MPDLLLLVRHIRILYQNLIYHLSRGRFFVFLIDRKLTFLCTASPRMRPLSSPAPSNPSSKHHSALPIGSGYSPSPHLPGPGRTSTPTGHHPSSIPLNQTDLITKNGTPQQPSSSYPINSHNASPLMSSLQSSVSGRPPTSGGNGPDRDRERHSAAMVMSPRQGPSHPPPPPLSKMSTAQTVDGH